MGQSKLTGFQKYLDIKIYFAAGGADGLAADCLPGCLPACLGACLRACLPACLPACPQQDVSLNMAG
jgi:hypothetical protein